LQTATKNLSRLQLTDLLTVDIIRFPLPVFPVIFDT